MIYNHSYSFWDWKFPSKPTTLAEKLAANDRGSTRGGLKATKRYADGRQKGRLQKGRK